MNVFEILLIILGTYAITLLINSLILEKIIEELQHKCFIYKISADYYISNKFMFWAFFSGPFFLGLFQFFFIYINDLIFHVVLKKEKKI